MPRTSTRVWVTTTTAATDRASGRASARGRTTRELRVAPVKTTAREAGAPAGVLDVPGRAGGLAEVHRARRRATGGCPAPAVQHVRGHGGSQGHHGQDGNPERGERGGRADAAEQGRQRSAQHTAQGIRTYERTRSKAATVTGCASAPRPGLSRTIRNRTYEVSVACAPGARHAHPSCRRRELPSPLPRRRRPPTRPPCRCRAP